MTTRSYTEYPKLPDFPWNIAIVMTALFTMLRSCSSSCARGSNHAQPQTSTTVYIMIFYLLLQYRAVLVTSITPTIGLT